MRSALKSHAGSPLRTTKRDFPYYSGDPVEISGRGWVVIMAALALAFAQLALVQLKAFPLNFFQAILFTGLPILAVVLVTRRPPTPLFRPIGAKGLAQAIGFGLLTVVTSMIVGVIMSQLMNLAPNASVADLAAATLPDLLLFLARTFIQLVGEELITILPFLAVLWLCVTRLGLSRKAGLILGFVVSTLLFCALHLPTYDWNLLQCLGTIGSARIILTFAYVTTRNLWVSATAHVVNDWSLFLMSYAGGHLPIGAEDVG